MKAWETRRREKSHTVKRKWRVTDVVQVVGAAAQSREGEKRGNAHRKSEAGMANTDAAGAGVGGNARKLRKAGEQESEYIRIFFCLFSGTSKNSFFTEKK